VSVYTVVHGRRSLQMATNRLVIPAAEVTSFASAVHCSQALTSLLEHERGRVNEALQAAEQLGFEQGQQKGEEAALQNFTQALAKLTQELKAQQDTAREAVSVLALAVVHKLSEALGAAQVVPRLIEQAVLELLPARPTRIRVSPQAFEETRAHMAHTGLDAEVRVDEGLNAFDCVIESEQGQNVVGLETQLGIIGEALGVKPELDLELV
jgi:flagellar biosynthesis/type III secretory pathway protein FliH